jgi:hypothetical protein
MTFNHEALHSNYGAGLSAAGEKAGEKVRRQVRRQSFCIPHLPMLKCNNSTALN